MTQPIQAAPAEAPVPPAKVRKMMKIQDVICVPWGNRFGNDVRFTQPTQQDITQAIAEGNFEERPFSDNAEALFNEWLAGSRGGDDREEFIRLATRYHAGRIATLVRDGWTDPIGVYRDNRIHDGSHRIYAAVFRGDLQIEAEIG